MRSSVPAMNLVLICLLITILSFIAGGYLAGH
jgi:hypothetical protein